MKRGNNEFEADFGSRGRAQPRLRKSLGQFLLNDPEAARFIAEAIPKGRLVVEIGPGQGALTKELLKAGHRVVGVELDPKMVAHLERTSHRRDFRVVQGSILKSDWSSLSEGESEIVVTGNLPYHLTSPILFHVFDHCRCGAMPAISEMVMMVQKEFAQRLTAPSGGKQYGSLTLLTRFHGSAEYMMTVPASHFRPVPAVDGGVFRMKLLQPDSMPAVDYDLFRRVVRGSFAQRRKMMRNALMVINDLPENWRELPFDFTLRPERFTFEDFVRLTVSLFPDAKV